MDNPIDLRPDSTGPGGFVINGHSERYSQPFKSKPALKITVYGGESSGDVRIEWEAQGFPEGTLGGQVEHRKLRGSLPDDPPGWWKRYTKN